MREAAQSKVAKLARAVAREVVQDESFRQLVRETVLLVLVEQEAQRRATAARTFLSACAARGVHVSLSPEGRIMATNSKRMGADLKAVLTVYRPEIIGFLEKHRDMEERTKRRQEADGVHRNGNHIAPARGGG